MPHLGDEYVRFVRFYLFVCLFSQLFLIIHLFYFLSLEILIT